MADFDALLNRWLKAGALDAESAARIRAWEEEQLKPSGLRWQGLVALVLGAILLGCGVVLFVSAHWDRFGPAARFLLVIGMVTLFHGAGALTRKHFRGLASALHAVGTVSTGAAIALVGQIFNIEAHWPSAVLLWAVAALAGWALLRDQAQQILTYLLFPAWAISEFTYYAEGRIGFEVFLGRFLMVWAVLYLTAFLGSKRKLTQAVLFALAAAGAIVAVVLMLTSWRSFAAENPLTLAHQMWGWVLFAFAPLFFAVFSPRRSLIPVAVAVGFSLALPWCYHTFRSGLVGEPNRSFTVIEVAPNLLAYALVAAFALFLTWWAVRLGSRILVNLGAFYFALTVGWFYFSNIFNEVNRSLGLIGLGVLFLAGGWALEKARRRLLRRMGTEEADAEGAE